MRKKLTHKLKNLKFYETIKHGSVYSFSFIIVQFISLVSLPIYTKLLQPKDFGIYEVFNHIVRIAALILPLNLATGFYRYYFDEHVDKTKLLQYTFRMSLYGLTIGLLVFFIFRKFIFAKLNLPDNLFLWIALGIISYTIVNIFNTYNNIILASKRQAIWQIVFQLAKVIASVVLIYYFFKNYEGRIIGETGITFILAILIFILYFRNYISLKGKPYQHREIFKYALSFIPIGLSGYLLGFIDTVMINAYKGNNDAGLYSYAYKIAIIYSGISVSFITANRPKLFQLLNDNKPKEIVGQMRSIFKLIVAMSALFIYFAQFGGEILTLNDNFNASLYLLPLLVLGYVFSDINEVFIFYYHFKKKVKYFYYNFAFSALLNIGLNIVLIPKFGYAAAAYTTLISYAVMCLITYITCKFALKVTVPAIINFIDYGLIVLFVFVSNYALNFYIPNIWLQLSIKGVIYGLILLYLWRNLITAMLNKSTNQS